MAACGSCGGEMGAGSRFCPACGLAQAYPPVVRAARKVVTVVFVDVTGSTSLGEQLDPESLQRVMSRYFVETRVVFERHEGTVAKFIGDAVMAVFGIPVVHEDDALRAVQAATEIADALAQLNETLEADSGVRLEVRTGVNTGEVVVEHVSSAEGLAVGDAVNVAARLEQAASPGEILLGPDTVRLVRDAVRTEALAPLTVKGKAAPVRAHRLLEILPRASAPVRNLDSPLVGRERESAALASAFGRAVADRSCQLFTVLGPAGIGKSRLVAELIRAASAAGEATVLAGRCLPYGDGITFWPVAEIVDQAAGLIDDEPVEDARAKLLALLEGEDGAEQTVDRVAQLLGLAPPGLGTEELFLGVRSLLEALARRRPLVVVFDDIHWAEPTMLALIEHVAEWSRDSPLLLVCPARPELLDACPGWGGGQLNASSVLLEPLADDEATTLLQNLMGTAQLPPQVADRITTAAEGNPLFVEEMLAALIDDGHLRAEGDTWVEDEDLSVIPVPPSIAALLAARLDRLGTAERTVLTCASVVGKVFWRSSVAELVPPDLRADTVAHLASLVRRDLIRPERSSFAGDDAYHFRHLLIRDAAYAALPKESRATLHEAFAAWLERTTGERVTEYEPIFGYHLEQAFRLRAELGPVGTTEVELARRSATWLAAAGRRALVQEDNPASLSLLGRAADLLDPHDPARLALLPDLGDVLLDAGRFGQAEALLAEAVALSSMAGDRGLQAHAAVVALRARFIGLRSLEGWTEDDEDEAHAAIRIFTELDDHCGLARALEVLTHRNWDFGRLADAEVTATRALGHARAAGDRRRASRLLGSLAAAVQLGPTPAEEGLRHCERYLAEVRGHRAGEARVSLARAGLEAMLGAFDRARCLLAESRSAYESLGQSIEVAMVSQTAFDIEMLASDPVAAEVALRPSFRSLEAVGEKFLFSTVAAQLAHAVGALGRSKEAEELTLVAEEAAAEDDALSQVLWRTARAKVLASWGEVDAAERLAREAVALVGTTDFLNDRGHALLDLAEVLARTGRSTEAVPFAREASALFARKGNVVAVDRAAQRLVALAG